MLKAITPKKPAKDHRERLILLGLVELYLETGKPIGSNTLKENGFDNLSSATIRNYFSKLEETGFLVQHHSSGGRIPTHLAFKLYAKTHLSQPMINEKDKQVIKAELTKETREIASYLQHAAEVVSDLTGCAVFLSAPRFDHDFILDIKLVSVDQNRCLCILVTDFGLVHTEILYTEKRLSNFSLKRIEAYLHWRISGLEKPEINAEEEAIASRFYKEIMLRHIVNYSNFSTEDLYKTGFSNLLNYPDFNNAAALASGLALFENRTDLSALLRECAAQNQLSCWIGDELPTHNASAPSCTVIAIPYRIHQSSVGAIALLGPNRISYKRLFGILEAASEYISASLTRSSYKFKIAFRQPNQVHEINKAPCMLLEDKGK